MKNFLMVFVALFIANSSFAQDKEVRVGCIGFYNVENLFDTLDTPDVRDTEFTPDGVKLWNTTLYHEKLGQLAKVISQMGTEMTPDGVALLGVAEVENRKVLEDLTKHPTIIARNYKVVHFDSPDKRGIDVGLLYQPKYFKVEKATQIPANLIEPDGSKVYTRDILLVSGQFDGELLHVLVNHWSSRGGGEAASSWRREGSAKLNKYIVDSLQTADPNAKVIIMGDLNDDPISPSVKKILAPKIKPNKVEDGDLFNPMYAYFKKGIGTLAWRDSWNLFDQIIVSSGLVRQNDKGYHFYKARVFNQKYLQTKTGQYKGYPWRTFSGDNYIGGYSDHFPVYVFLVKEL
ncbi:MAG: hypothetical protein ACI9XO_003114 [Paraglaciecola sp.]|jgi:hypothetical protein